MASQEIDAIEANCNNVLSFLQDDAVKAHIVVASPLYLHAYKHDQEWFHHWSTHHITPLSTPLATAPQEH